MNEPTEEKYVVEVNCQNCKKPFTFEIEKGVSVVDCLYDETCPICECNLIKVKRDGSW